MAGFLFVLLAAGASAAVARANFSPPLDAAARAAIDPDKFVWVVVGDASVVEPQLEQLGLPVERIEMDATQ